MSTSTATLLHLPEGQTLRKAATALAREWLPEFLAKTGPKAPRWVIQPVVEPPENGTAPLWEAGISTEEYEERLDSTDLAWAIRANIARGRGKGSILARIRLMPEDLHTAELTVFPAALPETLFDSSKLEAFAQEHGLQGLEGLFVGLLTDNGFSQVYEH